MKLSDETDIISQIRSNLKLLSEKLYMLQQDLEPSAAKFGKYTSYANGVRQTRFEHRLSEIYENIERRSLEVARSPDTEISRKYLEKDEARRSVAAASWLGGFVSLNAKSSQTKALGKAISEAAEQLTLGLGFLDHDRFANNGFSREDIMKILKLREKHADPELKPPITPEQAKLHFAEIKRRLGSIPPEPQRGR